MKIIKEGLFKAGPEGRLRLTRKNARDFDLAKTHSCKNCTAKFKLELGDALTGRTEILTNGLEFKSLTYCVQCPCCGREAPVYTNEVHKTNLRPDDLRPVFQSRNSEPPVIEQAA